MATPLSRDFDSFSHDRPALAAARSNDAHFQHLGAARAAARAPDYVPAWVMGLRTTHNADARSDAVLQHAAQTLPRLEIAPAVAAFFQRTQNVSNQTPGWMHAAAALTRTSAGNDR
jgi:hypothetical protein